jgi:hypothetical protein
VGRIVSRAPPVPAKPVPVPGSCCATAHCQRPGLTEIRIAPALAAGHKAVFTVDAPAGSHAHGQGWGHSWGRR